MKDKPDAMVRKLPTKPKVIGLTRGLPRLFFPRPTHVGAVGVSTGAVLFMKSLSKSREINHHLDEMNNSSLPDKK